MGEIGAFSDSGPLIYFAKLKALEVLCSVLGPVAMTPAVYHETVVAGKAGGKPDAIVIERALDSRLLVVRELDETERRLSEELRAAGRSLGRGECETIACGEKLALQVVLQDRKARMLAEARGVRWLYPHSVLLLGVLRRRLALEEYNRLLLGLASLTEMSVSLLLELQQQGASIERGQAGRRAAELED